MKHEREFSPPLESASSLALSDILVDGKRNLSGWRVVASTPHAAKELWKRWNQQTGLPILRG